MIGNTSSVETYLDGLKLTRSRIMLKSVLLTGALFSSSVVLANVQWKMNVLPQELKILVEKALKKECAPAYDLVEVSSTEEEQVIDQGVRDLEYVTELSGKYNFDGDHPVGGSVKVVSKGWDLGRSYEVLEVTGNICKL
jgi:hypothetical protein